ncbi:glycosyltransferase [Azonexus sp.]|uniref:glycosyltransferase n=1 Tax=Azonexus sp. TaxID=1872668 RepID=UPI0035B1D6FB
MEKKIFKETDRAPRYIAIFIPNVKGGGAERVMVTLANTFASSGHRVDLLLGSAEGEYLSEVASAVNIVNFNVRRAVSCLFPLLKYLREKKPDAILSALNYINIISIIAHKLARSTSRLVVSERNTLVCLKCGWVNKLIYHLISILYPAANSVISVTKEGAVELIDAFNLSSEKVYSISNPLEVNRIKELSKSPFSHPWLESNQPPIVLAVGRLSPQKNFSALIQAFSILRSQRLAHLVILGEGPLRGKLESQINDLGLQNDVLMPGFVENPFKWMARCKIFVLSSDHEGYPNVLIQAMACGAKIISTNCPTGPYEILEGGRLGTLVAVGDVVALGAAMIKEIDSNVVPDYSVKLLENSPQGISGQYISAIFGN